MTDQRRKELDYINTRFKRYRAKEPHPQNGCINWTGCLTEAGYGCFHWNCALGRSWTVSAHVAAFLLAHNSLYRWWGRDWQVAHKCHNRSCVNPEHLELKTRSENVRETWRSV